jgi:hypothetical protein
MAGMMRRDQAGLKQLPLPISNLPFVAGRAVYVGADLVPWPSVCVAIAVERHGPAVSNAMDGTSPTVLIRMPRAAR